MIVGTGKGCFLIFLITPPGWVYLAFRLFIWLSAYGTR